MRANSCRLAEIRSSVARDRRACWPGPRSLAAPGAGVHASMQPQGQEVRSPAELMAGASLVGSFVDAGCPLGGSRPVVRGSQGGPLLGRIIRRSDLNVTRFIRFF